MEKPEEDLDLAATLMERGGTGGALFRNMYRDLLGERVALVGGEELEDGYRMMFEEIGPLWTEVAARIQEAVQTAEQRHLDRASELLSDLSERERAAMQALSGVGPASKPAPAPAKR